jgi:hypothetical protein
MNGGLEVTSGYTAGSTAPRRCPKGMWPSSPESVAMHHNTLKRLTMCTILVLLAGCAAKMMALPPNVSKTSLDFLEDGKTTKEAVILKLGPPFGTFEGERIISYRIGKTHDGYFVPDHTADPYP